MSNARGKTQTHHVVFVLAFIDLLLEVPVRHITVWASASRIVAATPRPQLALARRLRAKLLVARSLLLSARLARLLIVWTSTSLRSRADRGRRGRPNPHRGGRPPEAGNTRLRLCKAR